MFGWCFDFVRGWWYIRCGWFWYSSGLDCGVGGCGCAAAGGELFIASGICGVGGCGYDGCGLLFRALGVVGDLVTSWVFAAGVGLV